MNSTAYRTAVAAGAQGLRALISDLNGKGELRLRKRRQRAEKCFSKSLATDRHADGVVAAMLEIVVIKMKRSLLQQLSPKLITSAGEAAQTDVSVSV